MNSATLLATLPSGGAVLDVGCFGFTQMKAATSVNRPDLRHSGVDYCEPPDVPTGYTFRRADLNKEPIPFPDDQFDLVVASHVIEHLREPVEFFGECLRVCKPGGRLFLATPSERALMLPGFPFAWDMFHSSSFFDDPTHLGRPFSPQSLWRLTRYYGCTPVKAAYEVTWLFRLVAPIVCPLAILLRSGWLLEYVLTGAVGWASFIIVEKPASMTSKPPFNYYIPANRTDDWLGKLIKRVTGIGRSARNEGKGRRCLDKRWG
jgi:SAM-dependent methyltransferase